MIYDYMQFLCNNKKLNIFNIIIMLTVANIIACEIFFHIWELIFYHYFIEYVRYLSIHCTDNNILSKVTIYKEIQHLILSKRVKGTL